MPILDTGPPYFAKKIRMWQRLIKAAKIDVTIKPLQITAKITGRTTIVPLGTAAATACTGRCSPSVR